MRGQYLCSVVVCVKGSILSFFVWWCRWLYLLWKTIAILYADVASQSLEIVCGRRIIRRVLFGSETSEKRVWPSAVKKSFVFAEPVQSGYKRVTDSGLHQVLARFFFQWVAKEWHERQCSIVGRRQSNEHRGGGGVRFVLDVRVRREIRESREVSVNDGLS